MKLTGGFCNGVYKRGNIVYKTYEESKRFQGTPRVRKMRERQSLRLVGGDLAPTYKGMTAKYLKMQYIEGELFHTLLAKKQGYDYLFDAGMLLYSIHKMGLIHGDFCPNNLLIRKTDSKLIAIDWECSHKASNQYPDFGIYQDFASMELFGARKYHIPRDIFEGFYTGYAFPVNRTKVKQAVKERCKGYLRVGCRHIEGKNSWFWNYISSVVL